MVSAILGINGYLILDIRVFRWVACVDDIDINDGCHISNRSCIPLRSMQLVLLDPFVLFLYVIVSSVILRFVGFYYPYRIVKPFLMTSTI